MSVGIYGTIRPSDVSVNDMDVFYSYAPTRQTIVTQMGRLEAKDFISNLTLTASDSLYVQDKENVLEGMYNLKLPATTFNKVGIYTIYIRPKVFKLKIVDCGVLSALPNVRGILVNTNDLPSTDYAANNYMQGFKIEYINNDGTKLRNTVRYIVTANRAVPVIENIGDTTQRSVRYRFSDDANLLFLQITPNSGSNVKPNQYPFIGVANQEILVSNTYFNPIAIEVEMVKNTIDTVMNVVAGQQIKDVDNGIITYYDDDGNIVKQFDIYEIKEDIGIPASYEVKQNRNNIDFSQDFKQITEF